MPFTLIETDNHLVHDKIARLRDRTTESEEYVRLLEDLSALLAFHVASDTPVEQRVIATPRRERTEVQMVPANCRFLVFSLFRAAVPMARKLKSLLPNCGVVHVVYRAKAIVDVRDLPDDPRVLLASCRLIIADPIIGTGQSILKIVELLESWGVSAKQIRVICMAAAESGISRILEKYPELMITGLVKERTLLADGYLDPGFGDVGNRVFGL